MSPPTLLSACIRKTGELLLSGVWEGSEESLFSCMPASLVEELLSRTWPAESTWIYPRLEQSVSTLWRLLLTSGKLEHFALPRGGNGKDYTAMLQWLSRCCQNLRTLSIVRGDRKDGGSWYFSKPSDAKLALQQILQKSTRLELLHSCLYFDPDDLKNCTNLKTLRLHFGSVHTKMFFRRISADLWERFRSLGVLAVCLHPSSAKDDEELCRTRAILDNCPQLTSLGLHDTSAVLEEHAAEPRTAPPIQLRRCYWEDSRWDVSPSVYCDGIRAAASSCPVMEALVIKVRHAGALRHLRALGNLTCLALNFDYCGEDFGQEFYFLLKGIGPQLRRLSVESSLSSQPVSVDAICGNCPNLNTLELLCPMTTDEGVQHLDHLLKLERLNIKRPDRRTLSYLLGNALNLKVLCLDFGLYLDDETLRTILWQNPFAELEVALIRWYSFSETVLKIFLRSAVKLGSFCLSTGAVWSENGAEPRVRRLNPGATFHYPHYFTDLQTEQFLSDYFSCCWL